MKKRIIFAIIILIFSSICLAQTPSQLFQQALLKENGEGDLKAAIEIYEKILDDADADRSIRAKSLLHIGLCWEKLGKQEAKNVYKKLINEFSDQSEFVATAQSRLESMEKINGGLEPKGLSLRKIVDGGLEIYDAPAPNGKELARVDPGTGNLAILDVVTEKQLLITKAEGNWDEFAEFIRWSPDGNHLAYSWYSSEKTSFQLRVIRVDGSDMRIIHPGGKDVFWIQPVDWSLDGENILALFSFNDGKKKMVLINVADNSMKTLMELGDRWPAARFSPDGHFIAYDIPQNENSIDHDIFLFSLNDSSRFPIIQNDADDFFLGWVPTKNQILFASDRSGNHDVWIVEVVEGKVVGEPSRVRTDIGRILPLGITNNGTFYYALRSGKRDTYIANIDFESGTTLTAPELVVPFYSGENRDAEWSPDGKYLAYVSERGKRIWFNPQQISIHSIETGEHREFSIKGYSTIYTPRWSQDGKKILLHCLHELGKRELCILDAQSGETEFIRDLASMPREDYTERGHLWTPDGKGILLWSIVPKEKIRKFFIYEPADKTEREVYRNIWSEYLTALAQGMGYSPDGKWFAYITDTVLPDNTENKKRVSQINLIPADGGESKVIKQLEGNGRFLSICWTPDSKHLVYQTMPFSLSILSIESGESKKLELNVPTLFNLRIHPDGKQVVFDAGRRIFEVWAMENFLPE